MNGLLFAFLTALSESLKDVTSKHGLKQIDEYVVSWMLRSLAFLFLLPLLFFIDIPAVDAPFWAALLVSGVLNVAATVLYMKALKSSDLSLSVPMVTFTPLFLLLTSPLIVGEYPSVAGMAGVVLIVAGSYLMNIQTLSGGWLSPFQSLWKQAGPRYMLFVAFIWSISSNFDKVGVQHSSPIFWSISVSAFIALGLLPLVLWKSEQPVRQIEKGFFRLLPIGLFTALGLFFQMTAIKLTLVAYVISIKRTSAILAVIWGGLIFGESKVRQRLLGAVIMVFGVICITLS